jgi:glycosyltransferase involved in cell wall biosynthesis
VRISVVVPTYRRPESLEACLAALSRQQRMPDEVVVVARADDAPALAVVDAFGARGLPVRTAQVPRPGLVAALNTGLDAATGDVVAITDDDAEPRPGWLARAEGIFASDDRVGGVGGRDWVHYGERLVDGHTDEVGRVRWNGKLVGLHHLASDGRRDVEILKGVNMIYRRSALAEVRFDERMRGAATEHNSEPSTCLRLRSRGWRLVYDPEVAVDHRPAPRAAGDRHLRDAAEIRAAVHNESLALLEYLPPPRRAAFMAWALLVGYVDAPGLVQAGRRAALGPREQTWTALRASAAGRIDAYRTYRRSLSAPAGR